MADTGAPWNIPYVENADLVKDYPTASLALANAIDAGLDAASNAGIGSNVVSAAKLDAFSTTSAADVTGLTVTITPTSATSKILILVQISFGWSVANNGAPIFNLIRGATDLMQTTGFSNANTLSAREFSATNGINLGNIVFLDSPASTSAQTYKIEAAIVGSGTLYVNRSHASTDVGSTSSITAIEVSA